MPPAPLTSDMVAEPATCHMRRDLRSWKKVFQSKGGMSSPGFMEAATRSAARLAAAASSWWAEEFWWDDAARRVEGTVVVVVVEEGL